VNVITILHFSSFIANALLIIFVLSRKPPALLNRVCAFLVATFAYWSFLIALYTMASSKEESMLYLNLSSLGWCFTPVAILWFYLALDKKDILLKNKAFMAACTLIATGFIYAQWSGNMQYDSLPADWGWTSIWKMSAVSLAYFAYFFIVYAACLYLLIDFGRKSKSYHQKMQAKLLIITGTIAMLLSSMTDVVFRIFDIRAIPDVGDIFFMIWGFGIVYAVSKYGLMSLTPTVAAETILSTIDDSIILLDANSQIVYTNRAAADLIVCNPDELSGTAFSSLFDDKEPANRLLEETLCAGRCANRELTYLSRTGKTIPVLVSTSEIRNSDNDIIGTVISAKDISELKQAEEALQETENAYRLLAENMTDTLWIMDLSLNITWMSPSSVKARDMSMNEIAAIPPDKQATPESFARATKLLVKMLSLEGEGQITEPNASVSIEMDFYRGDGSTHCFDCSFHFIRDKQGKATGILAQGRDITERKAIEKAKEESEKYYRLLAENTSDVVTIFNMNMNPVWVSESVQRATGYTPEEQKKIPVNKRMTPESLKRAIAHHINEIEKEKAGISSSDSPFNLELEVYRKDGSTLWTENRFRFIRDSNGKAINVIMEARDISERKKAEAALRKSENAYQLLAENTNDVISIFDIDLTLRWTSPSNERLTGYTFEELKNLPLEQQMDLASLQKGMDMFTQIMQDLQEGKEIPAHYEMEAEIFRKDRSTFWAECRFQFIRDSSGKPTGILMQGIDITERKKSQEALKKTQDTYRLLAEHMSDVVWMMDMDLNLTWISPSSGKVRGYSQEETYALPLERQLTPASLEKAVKLLGKWSHIERTSRTPQPDGALVEELEFTCKDDKAVILECAFQFIRDGQGKATGILAEGRDITAQRAAEKARQESEKSYRLLAENTTDVVTIMDMDLNITWLSPSCEKLTGYTTEEQKHLSIDKQMTPESLLKALNQFTIEVETEKLGSAAPDRHEDIELEIYHKDGHTLWTENIIQFIRDSQGKPVSILMQGRDITARKQAETALQKTLSELKRSNEELERFAYVASHDLQEPLRMVSSYVQLLEKRYQGKLDDDAHDFINYAVAGARRMQNLINDLLSYSRVGTRGKPFQPTESADVLAAAVSNLDVAIKEAGAVVEYGEMPRVIGDEGQLLQVFQNLIGNAVKFHSDAPPVVKVDALRKNGNWVFSVQDNGIGIDEQFYERIFQVFQRLHRDEYPGTGIGLSVAKKIVERHRGQMWLESEPGKGSTFYFTIPAQEKGGNDL
jgi:PAS domain S-box-containing protein